MPFSNIAKLSANLEKRWGAGSALGGMVRQGFSGRGFTGSPENIAQLTGEDYVNPRTGTTTPNIGGATWQDVDAGADPYAQRESELNDRRNARLGSTSSTTEGIDTTATTSGYTPTLGGGTVADIYRNQWGTEGDTEGIAWYQDQVDSGAMTLQQVQAHLQASELGEAYTTPNEQWLDDQFTDQFGRVTDVEGRNYYADLLRQGYSQEEVQQMIAGGATGGDATYTGQTDVGGDPMIDTGGSELTTDPTANNPTIGDVTGGEVPYGQIGYEQAANTGREQAEGYLETGYDEALDAYDPYAAATGALGPEAEQEFYDNYQMSPGQQYLQGQQEQARMRQASATGSLGGGGTQIALQRDAAGFAMQDMDKYLQRLGVSTEKRGEIMARRGETMGDLAWQTQQGIANQRAKTGDNLASDIRQAGTFLAGLDSTQAGLLSDLVANGTLTYQKIVEGLTQGTAEDQDKYLQYFLNLAQQGAVVGSNIELGRGSEATGGTDTSGFATAAGALIEADVF